MQSSMARRQFLKSAVAATFVASEIKRTAASTPDLTPQAPPSRMRVGLCAYSYREQLNKGGMSLDGLFAKAVELGVDALDMTVYYLKSTDAAYLEGIRHLAYRYALPFSGTACRSSVLDGDDAKRKATQQEIKDWIDVADRLGTSHLRIFLGPLRKGETMRQGIDASIETMKVVCDYSAKKGIMIGIEDHPGISENAEVCLEIMHGVGSPYAGINIDITHFIPTPTMDAYAQIEACLPYATATTHVRERFDDKTLIDMDRVWKMFAKANYKGYMSVEYDPDWAPLRGEPAITGIPKLVARTRELCRKYSTA
jgi:sugar phosphate isomerase/epimerase